MSRSERLLDLVQILRRHRRPVSGPRLRAPEVLLPSAWSGVCTRFFDKVRVWWRGARRGRISGTFALIASPDSMATETRYPRRRQVLLKNRWRQRSAIRAGS